MISNELKCIFLHPNKCGGKSVESALWNVEVKPGSADHRTIAMFREQYPDKVDEYFKFMFSRNPWDRLVSIYHGRKQILKVDMPSFEDFVRTADPLKSPTQAQYLWIQDGDRYTVDFVGKLERYDEDWKKVCRILEIDVPLPHHNKSRHKPYWKLYTDELADIVAEKYKEDIEYFGYKFRE